MEKTIGILGGMGAARHGGPVPQDHASDRRCPRQRSHPRLHRLQRPHPGPHGGHFVRRQRSRAGNGLGPALAGGLRRQLRHHALQHRALFSPPPAGHDEAPLHQHARSHSKDLRGAVPGRTAAVLATKGTLATGLYEQALAAQNVRCLIPDAGEQDVLMHLIYDIVKASRPLAPEEGTWQRLLDALRARGADYFILGCTELPIVADTLPQAGPFVDPTAELAKAAIRFCGYRVKE